MRSVYISNSCHTFSSCVKSLSLKAGGAPEPRRDERYFFKESPTVNLVPAPCKSAEEEDIAAPTTVREKFLTAQLFSDGEVGL